MASKKISLPIVSSSNSSGLVPLLLPTEVHTPDNVPPLTITREELESRNHWRTSSYTIYVDLPDEPDTMLLVHSYTGAYDVVSKRVATFLRSQETKRPPKPLYGSWTPEEHPGDDVPLPSSETIEALKERGYLVALSRQEEESLFTKLSSSRHHGALRGTPNYIIIPTYQCNLRCPYCFQDHMRTNDQFSHLLRPADRSMVDRIIAGMLSIDSNHGIDRLDTQIRGITLFGGEPLLKEGYQTIKYLIDKLNENWNVRITAITNATDLYFFRDLLGREGISRIQVTLDGIPAEHDKRRIRENGAGTFSEIAKNISMALEEEVSVNVRMNIDRSNINDLPQLMDMFHEYGWTDRSSFYCYVAPIHAANERVDPTTTFNSWQLQKAIDSMSVTYPQLANMGLADDAIQRQARSILGGDGDRMPTFRTAFCGANTSMYVIDSFADLYACWERTGDVNVRIGHIDKDGKVLIRQGLMDSWRNRNNVSNPVCRRCRYASYCGGGCQVLAAESSGHGFSNYCDGYAKRFRSSLAKAFQEHLRGDHPAASFSIPCDI